MFVVPFSLLLSCIILMVHPLIVVATGYGGCRMDEVVYFARPGSSEVLRYLLHSLLHIVGAHLLWPEHAPSNTSSDTAQVSLSRLCEGAVRVVVLICSGPGFEML